MKIITSESVGIGHPDKICDQISDLILVNYLRKDKDASVACECFFCNDTLIIGGEITANIKLDHIEIAKSFLANTLRYEIENFKFIDLVNKQSQNIAQAVKKSELAAGDQGLVYGYATNESENFMPVGYNLANDLVFALSKNFLENEKDTNLLSDCKSQVTMVYDDKDKPLYIDTILVSSQHKKNKFDAANVEIRLIIRDVLIKYKKYVNDKLKIIVNPSGKFEIGGPIGDTGLTGRKIIVDTYGGLAKHGGGCFSGKDFSKVDRTGAYYARFLAKKIVANKFAEKAEVQIAFGIGMPNPIAINIDLFKDSKNKNAALSYLKENNYLNWSVGEMVDKLMMPHKHEMHLLSCFGHFGRHESDWKWEL